MSTAVIMYFYREWEGECVRLGLGQYMINRVYSIYNGGMYKYIVR